MVSGEMASANKVGCVRTHHAKEPDARDRTVRQVDSFILFLLGLYFE
jgi:hypothetical protein